MSWPENCSPSGTTAVCTVPEVSTGSSPTTVPLTVRAEPGAAPGATGRVVYRAQATTTQSAEPLTAVESHSTVTLGSGPDLSLHKPEPLTGLTPGASATVPLSLVNRGNQRAEGVVLGVGASYGLTLDQVASGCIPTATGGSDRYPPSTGLECTFDEVVEPGATFAPPELLKVTAAAHALYERVDISVRPLGTGATDLDLNDNSDTLRMEIPNTADFSVNGMKLTAAAGETVAADIMFRNRGPAWVGHVNSGRAAAVVDFIVPEGVTVTVPPSTCAARTLEGQTYPTRTGAPRYQCYLPYWVTEKQAISVPFQLRIDTVVPDAAGQLELRPQDGAGPLPFDPDVKNNTAKLMLNPTV